VIRVNKSSSFLLLIGDSWFAFKRAKVLQKLGLFFVDG
jgi:hypothetical protein